MEREGKGGKKGREKGIGEGRECCGVQRNSYLKIDFVDLPFWLGLASQRHYLLKSGRNSADAQNQINWRLCCVYIKFAVKYNALFFGNRTKNFH